jgi:digeranylgeranylglycerophospholipid reductase
MSGQFYDVIIVGAGPAGSYIAYELASLGQNVAVFEEKSAPGLNACCTGIISIECFQSLGLGTDGILTRINSARFFSPSGRCLRLQTENNQAYVVNRLLLDKAIASKAQSQGAQYFFSSPVIEIIPGKDNIQAETLCSGTREIFNARVVVLANGFKPKMPRKLGLGKIKNFLLGAQAEIEAKNIHELEVYFSQEIAPGAFAWLVPTSPNKAYVGLLAASQAKLHLQKFLNNLFYQGKVTSPEARIEQKAVPLGTLARSYGDRILVIGDAAGQVKPTTGGGIYFGHIGAKIAAGVLDDALRHDDLAAGQLSRYQKQWKAKMGKELSRAYRARWAYTKLSDRQIEGIFNALEASGIAEVLLNSSDFSFDWHSKLIMAVLKHSSAYPLLKIKQLLYSEASS